MSTPVSTTVCHQYYIQQLIQWATGDREYVFYPFQTAQRLVTTLNMLDRKYHWRSVKGAKGEYYIERAGKRT